MLSYHLPSQCSCSISYKMPHLSGDLPNYIFKLQNRFLKKKKKIPKYLHSKRKHAKNHFKAAAKTLAEEGGKQTYSC